MVKKNWIIANWKSNKTISEAVEWVSLVGPKVPKQDNLAVVVCPQFDCLEGVKKTILVGNFSLLVGAQDISPFPPGAFTGEESATALKQFIDLVIIGHSERRKLFGENDHLITQKAERALEKQITPLVCLQDKDTFIPPGVNLVAYEPIFAIGSGQADTPDNANLVAAALKSRQENLNILYGGSVTSVNVKAFLQQDNLSGCLIGGASLEAQEFIKILEVAATF